MKVLVVLLNWNGAADTLRCLPDILAQKNVQADLLVVDNASADDSVARIRHAYPELEVVKSQRNRGFGGGCNLGIEFGLKGNYEFVWLLNNDTRVADDALAELVEVACASHKAGAVGSVIYNMEPPHALQLWGGGMINLWLGTSRLRRSPGPVDFLSGASLLLRLSALREVGVFDESRFFMYWEDADLSQRLVQAGWELAVAPGSRIWHAESSSLGRNSPLRTRYFTLSAIAFMKKHCSYPRLSIAINAILRIGKQIVLFRWSNAAYLARLYLQSEIVVND